MSEQEKQENQKTIVAFAAGLLIGGLLVWVFGGTPNTEVEMNEETETEETQELEGSETGDMDADESSEEDESPVTTPVLQTGEGDVDVDNQDAGTRVALNSATFPSDEGWVGVREYTNDQLGGLLGVARYSKEQGLVPQEVILQRSTQSGKTYAIVFYSENGDRTFSLANDTQIEGIASTFEVN